MIKKILFALSVALIAAYLILSATAFNVEPHGQVCKDFDLLIKDSVNARFVTKKEVTAILKKDETYPVGRPMEAIVCKTMEETLAKHPLIDEVECYKTPNGKVTIEVTQRIPVMRVMARNGENYFIDNKGGIMPSQAKCVAHLAIATGNVDKAFATNELYAFAQYLRKNKFWNAQIEQINVLPTKEIELVPRVGNHIVFLGKMDDYENKLERLKHFYKKGLNKVGWNKYKRINVEFGNQIICTRK